MGVGRVELAASLGVTEAEPVGGLVAGSREARRLHEGLDPAAIVVRVEPDGGVGRRIVVQIDVITVKTDAQGNPMS